MNEPLPHVVLHNGFVLPDDLKRRLLWGGKEQGRAWLERAPRIVRAWCERWDIALDRDVPVLSYNLVLFGTSRKYGDVVLKLAPPHPEVRAEVEATIAATGPGLVRLIAADPDVAIMLMERVRPGTPLRTFTASGALSDDEATRIAAGEMAKTWVGPPREHRLFPLDRWFHALFAYREAHPEGDGPLPAALVARAVEEARHLLTTQETPVVLHGDVHHDNILADDAHGWTLIDLKGLVGERGYEVGTWMLNPPGLEAWPDLGARLARRLEIFAAELAIPRHRLWQWSIAHAVLSACWSLEEGEELTFPAIRVIETIAELEPERR